jgi:hypothetical protein
VESRALVLVPVQLKVPSPVPALVLVFRSTLKYQPGRRDTVVKLEKPDREN